MDGGAVGRANSHWLLKTESRSCIKKGVDVKFGIEDLRNCKDQTTCWDGVRNPEARNCMKSMKLGDLVFFYHCTCKIPGIAGICKVVKEAYPDHTQFDENSPFYDKASKDSNPKWFMVDVQFDRMLKRYIPLSELKQHQLQHEDEDGPLKDLALFRKKRLSVQPISKEAWDFIVALENNAPEEA